jgi:hypothetical protein
MKAKKLLSCLALIGAAGVFEARAEVSAKLDEDGQYAGMYVRIVSSTRRIWSGGLITINRRPLNPNGDALGDLAPTIVENPRNLNYPTVVWSHPNGPDYDLVYSRWTGGSWAPMAFVQNDNLSNDLEPRLAFTPNGRPYLVWWSDEGGTGSVYFSMFLESRWMTPVRVSTPGTDSRHADLYIANELTVTVSFDTPGGRTNRIVTIPNRSTITDDIDPKIRGEIVIDD